MTVSNFYNIHFKIAVIYIYCNAKFELLNINLKF